jgi:hypothetical protein
MMGPKTLAEIRQELLEATRKGSMPIAKKDKVLEEIERFIETNRKSPRRKRRTGVKSSSGMTKDRREKRKRWVQRGQYAVEVEVEVIYPADDPSEPCLEPGTVRWLDEVAQRAAKGDVKFLRGVGRVFKTVPAR